MPELPEVETVVRELRPCLEGRRLCAIRVGKKPLRRAWSRPWARRLIGRYVPTAKNGQAATLYSQRGFRAVGEHEFHLDLTKEELEMPSEIEIRVPAGA